MYVVQRSLCRCKEACPEQHDDFEVVNEVGKLVASGNDEIALRQLVACANR